MTNEQTGLINEQLRYLGFHEHHGMELSRFDGLPEFELEQTCQYRGQQLDSVLHFRKSQHYNIYFLSRHRMTLGGRTQMFVLIRGKGITRKEGYNLLSGRAVYRKQVSENGLEYFAWWSLNFNKPVPEGYEVRRYYDNHGFDIIRALLELGLTNYTAWEQAMLIRSLQRGNRQPVLTDAGKVYLMANPRTKTIDVHLPTPLVPVSARTSLATLLPADPTATLTTVTGPTISAVPGGSATHPKRKRIPLR